MRIGIYGFGAMGAEHARYLTEDPPSGAKLTAIGDVRPERLSWAKDHVPGEQALYNNEKDFFASDKIDAVLIATPHYSHPELAVTAFEAGLHVLIEKPAGVYTKQVRMMNQAAESVGKIFGIMFNQRTLPLYAKIKSLVDEGELGEIKRTNWIITNWYRPESYYASADWRATWKGEGGGVLLNQCPHQLDLWQWICGMPAKVRGFCHFGKWHNIEVEDDVTAYVEYPNGGSGVFVSSTGDAPGTNRFEISCDRGRVVVENDTLRFDRLTVSEREFNRTYQGRIAQPESWECKIPIPPAQPQHKALLEDWVDSIRTGSPLLAPGIEGINSLMLSNAIYLSSWENQMLNLPIDEDLFFQHLTKRINGD